MTIEFSCPNCASALKAPDEYVGKLAKCKKCQNRFRIPGDDVELEPEFENVPKSGLEPIVSDVRKELKDLGFPDLKSVSLRDLSDADVQAIFDWGVRTFQLGSSEQGTIHEIKYEGHLIKLSDDSRWEVDDGDAYTADGWGEGDEVVVVNGRMYRLDDLEGIEVTKE